MRLRGVARGLLIASAPQIELIDSRDEYLEELAVMFEYAAAHEVEFIPDDHEIDEPLRHASMPQRDRHPDRRDPPIHDRGLQRDSRGALSLLSVRSTLPRAITGFPR